MTVPKKAKAPSDELVSFRRTVRAAFGDYVASEGCSCCQREEAHKEAGARLAKLLRVPKYSDGSGFNFWKFRSPAPESKP